MKTKLFGSFSPGDADMSAFSDEQLVLEALGDSHQAFGQLVKQYQYRVLRTIASIISDREAAQDVAQETFLSAWSNLAKLEEKHKFGRWLNQTAINLSKRWLRDQLKYQKNTASFEADVSRMRELRHQRDMLRQAVWDAIDGLPADHREVVILHYISGYSYKEISEMFSVPVSTIQGRLQKARNQLRKEFLDMVAQLQLEIDSTVYKFLKERAKKDGLSIEGLIVRLIEKYKRDMDRPEIAVRKILDSSDFIGLDFTGCPSPDGRYLSFTDWTYGDLAIHDLITGEDRDITDGGKDWNTRVYYVGGSVWSPDGKQIAYSWCSYELFDEPHELCIIGIDGSEPRVIYRGDKEVFYISPSTWSHDGKSILMGVYKNSSAGDLMCDITLVSVDDGSAHVLRSLECLNPNRGSWNDQIWMSLSPDGSYVAYDRPVEEHAGKRDIFLLATDSSGEEAPLVEHPANDYGPIWAPDGKSILFGSDRSGTSDAWLMRIANGKPVGAPQLVRREIGAMYPMGFTREGSLYYAFLVNSTDVYTTSIDPVTGELLEPPTKAIWKFEGFNGAPAWSPDGGSLAYFSLRPSSWGSRRKRVLVIRSEETGKERELHPEIYLHENDWPPNIRWSPDGRSILCGRWGHRLQLIDVQTGEVTIIVQFDPTDELIQDSAWSSDGKAIFYIRRRRGYGGSIVVRNLESGKEKELYKGEISLNGLGLAVSPDGSELVFPRGRAFMVMLTEGGEPRELVSLQDEEGIPYGCAPAWTADGRYVLFGKQKRRSDPDVPIGLPELWRIPAEGGESQKLLELETKGLRNISAHPDGQRIVFCSDLQWPMEIWAMENFLPGFTASK